MPESTTLWVHVAAFRHQRTEEEQWRVVDVWDSEESFRRFGENLMPAFQAAGVTAAEPQIFPVHNFVKE